MFSNLLGWLLIVLGIVSYVIALVALVRSLFARPPAPATGAAGDGNLQPVCDLLDQLVRALESFAQLSVPVQWAILGLLNIGIGAYLVANKPF